MKLYAGIDLHSNNIYLSIVNEKEDELFNQKLSLDIEVIINSLSKYKKELQGIVIESTYNWYWLADALKEHGYCVHLANPSAIKMYDGIKQTDDKTDARWLANLLRLGILKTGYIYPKEQRGLRELLRQRMRLTQQQTAILLGTQSLVTRYEGKKLSANFIKTMAEEITDSHIKDPNIVLIVKQRLKILKSFMSQIEVIQEEAMKQLKTNSDFKLLKNIPGIGDILSSLIVVETGDIKRFASAGDYCSYCRCVSSERKSNGKKKGENNRKNGNVYLSWAFIEAANFAIRYNDQIKKYYQRKMQRTNKIIALKTVAAKLSKACYGMLKNQEGFNMEVFGG